MKAIWVLLLLSFFAGTLQAEDKNREEADQLLLRAREVSWQPATVLQSYSQAGNFTFYKMLKGDEHGTYRRDWINRDNFVKEVRENAYQYIVVKKDGKFYRHENTVFTPVRVDQLIHLLPLPALYLDSSDVIRKLKDRKIGAVLARCIQYDTIIGARTSANEACVAKDSGYMVYSRHENREQFWSDFQPFAGRLVPRHAELRDEGDKMVEADVTYELRPMLTPSSLVLPSGLKPDPVCSSVVHPIRTSATDPIYPKAQPKMKGAVVLAILVGPDGRVHELQVIQSMGPGYDSEAQNAVKQWVYTPYLCDGKPLEFPTTVTVNFIPR